MAYYSQLIAAIENSVKTNGTGAITGATLQATLLGFLQSISKGYQFMGVATPLTEPGTPDEKVVYIGGAGVYNNFGSSIFVEKGSIVIFQYDSAWSHGVVNVASWVKSEYQIVNVNEVNNHPSSYNNINAARGAVPQGMRKSGLIITYYLSDGWYTEQFIEESVENWLWDTNWEPIYKNNTNLEMVDFIKHPESVTSAIGVYKELKDLKPIWDAMLIPGGYLRTDNAHYIGNADGSVVPGNDLYVIPLQGNETIFFGRSVGFYGQYTFAKSFDYPAFELVDWLSTDINEFTTSEVKLFDLADGNHDGARYLLLANLRSNRNLLPSICVINGKEIFKRSVDENQIHPCTDHLASSFAALNLVRNIVPFQSTQFFGGYLPSPYTGLLAGSSANGTTVAVPIMGAQELKMIGNINTTYYMLADEFVYPYYKRNEAYASVERASLPGNGQEVTIAVNGAKWLLYMSEFVGINREPQSIKIDGVQIFPDYNIRNDIDRRVLQTTFDNIVGDGLNRELSFIEYAETYLHEKEGATNGFRLNKGEAVEYSLLYRSSKDTNPDSNPDDENVGQVIFEVTKDYVQGWYSQQSTHYPSASVYFCLRADADSVKKTYTGRYVAEQDCWIKMRGFIPSADFPDDNSTAVVRETISDHLKDETTSRGFVKEFQLGTPKLLFANRYYETEGDYEHYTADELDSALNFTSVITLRNGLYYMYYQCVKKVYDYAGYGTCFAYSNDGENWVRHFPQGYLPVDPEAPDYNGLWPAGKNDVTEERVLSETTTTRRICVEYIEREGHQRTFLGPCIVKVDDDSHPFRLIGNKQIYYQLYDEDKTTGTRTPVGDLSYYYQLFMFKSADGINWGDYDDDAIEISEMCYDSHFSAIAYGNIIKIYCRMWDYQEQYPSQRQVGVMFIDLEGNIITSATILFGGGLYNSAAFKIDNKRELLLPTFFDTVNDICNYESFIVDGEKVMHSSDVDDKLKAAIPNVPNSGDVKMCWGSVNPGFILKDGDIYITYLQGNYSHGTNAQNPEETLIYYAGDYYRIPPIDGRYCCQMRLIPLRWLVNGSTNMDIKKP